MPKDEARSKRERGWTDAEIAERNRKVAEVQENICRIARLSPTGQHGIDFFDSIMYVYLAGRDAGWDAAIDAAIKTCHDLAYDGDMVFTAALACEKAILALKGDRNVEQSGTERK